MEEPLQQKEHFSENYKWYVLFILTLVYALNFFDRQLIVILQEPIKAELNLSDTQLGLMTGLVFAIFYSIMGIPIARFADSNNRRNVIGIALAIWSLLTALTGYVQSFFQMLLVRIGVGIGETGGTPPSHSIIADYFPMEKRATAYAIYTMGVYFGLFLSFILGGYLESTIGWRNAFIYLGLPGILFAVFLVMTVKEPPRGYSEKGKNKIASKSVKETFQFLMTRKTFILVTIGSALHSFVGFGFANWMPSFLMRVHGMTLIEAGFGLAIAVGIGGALGALTGGILADRLIKKNRRWYMWLALITIITTVPFSLYTLFSSNGTAAVYCYFIPNFLFSFNTGSIIAVILGIVSFNMRATTSAIYFLVQTLVGMGLGPLVVGFLSDYFEPTYQETSLRYALFIVSLFYFISGYFYWKASFHLERELDEMPVITSTSSKNYLDTQISD
jgi:MFS family permease